MQVQGRVGKAAHFQSYRLLVADAHSLWRRSHRRLTVDKAEQLSNIEETAKKRELLSVFLQVYICYLYLTYHIGIFNYAYTLRA